MEQRTPYISGVKRVSSAFAGALLGLFVAGLSLSGLFSNEGKTPPGHTLVIVGLSAAGAVLMFWRAGLPRAAAALSSTQERYAAVAGRGLATTAAACTGQVIGWQLLIQTDWSFSYEGSLLFLWMPTLLASAAYLVVGHALRRGGNTSTYAGSGGVLLVPAGVLVSLIGLTVFVAYQFSQYQF